MLAWHLRLSLLLAMTLPLGIVCARATAGVVRLTKEEIRNAFSELFKTSSQITQQLRSSVRSVSTVPRRNLDNITSGGGRSQQSGRSASCPYGTSLERDKCWSTCRKAERYYRIGSWYIVHFPPYYQFARVGSCALTSTSPQSCNGRFLQHVEQTFLVSQQNPATTYSDLSVTIKTKWLPSYCRCYF